MKPRIALLALLVLLAALATATAAEARTSYCSPSGDYCTGISKRNGKLVLRIGTFSFSGSYRLCVRAPDGMATCKRFRLFKTKGGIYASTKGWRANFPDRGKGVYRVRWQKSGSNLGPRLSFRH